VCSHERKAKSILSINRNNPTSKISYYPSTNNLTSAGRKVGLQFKNKGPFLGSFVCEEKTPTEPEEALSCVSSGGFLSKENPSRHPLPVLISIRIAAISQWPNMKQAFF
jgi:hypothetical protein